MDVLERLLPPSIKNMVNDLIKNHNQSKFEKVHPELQMIILILGGDNNVQELKSGPIMDRYQKPPLPRNGFQI